MRIEFEIRSGLDPTLWPCTLHDHFRSFRNRVQLVNNIKRGYCDQVLLVSGHWDSIQEALWALAPPEMTEINLEDLGDQELIEELNKRGYTIRPEER